MRYWVQYHYGDKANGYTVFGSLKRAMSFIGDYIESNLKNPYRPDLIATGATIEDRTNNETYYIPFLIHERLKESCDEKG